MFSDSPGQGVRAAAGHADAVSKQRYLVLHDYGMGGLWWWIHARSTREVLTILAERPDPAIGEELVGK
jgi:hypothetical protein